MHNIPIKKENETVYGELVDENLQDLITNNQELSMIQAGINHNQELSMIQAGINHNIRQFDKNLNYLNGTMNKYWNSQHSYSQIENNENIKYSNIKFEQDSLLTYINNSNFPYGIWRFKDKFYYRPKPELELCIGNAEEISEEISARYPKNVKLISDLNNVINNVKEIRSDTVFLATKSIIVIEDEVIEPTQQFEILQDYQGRFVRNLIINTEYLNKRFINYSFNQNQLSKTRHFIQQMTNIKDSLFLINRLGRFFKTLKGENFIVMVGNKDISKDIFLEKAISPMISPENYISITEDILKNKSVEEILKGKVLIHIDSIPTSQELKDKLKDLMIQVSIHKSFQMENKKIKTFAQVIVTLNKEDPFIKDFEHLSDIFYIEPMDDILSKTKDINDVSLISSIEISLMMFAEELSAIGVQQLSSNNYSTGNERFLLEVSDLGNLNDNLSDFGLPILDPFNDSFNSLIQMHNRIHSLILGGSGAGKTEQVKTNIYCDILREDGSVIVIDPHGDFAKDILSLPMDKDRIVFIDPALKDNMTPTLNIFENEEENISEKDIKLKANIIISVVKAINDEEKFSSSIKEMLYHCICVLLRKGNSSFKELFHFMNDKKNKKLVELGLQSPNELDSEFFEDYFNSGSSKSTKDALRRRLKTLLSDHYFSNLVNGKSTFDLEDLMNTKGKVIIFNVNKHNMPEHYGYFTRFIIELIQKIAFNRANIAKESRLPTYCYIDEGQNFLTSKIEEIFTEVRKYNLRMILSFQSLLQVKNKTTRNIIASNTNTKFFGKDDNGVPDILKHVLHKEAIDQVPNLNAGRFYLKANNQDLVLIENSDKLLDGKINISKQELEELIQNQLVYYREIETQKKPLPSEDELRGMIQRFKDDLLAKNLTETSCLHKLKVSTPKKFDEIEQNFEYKTIKEQKYTPRVLKRGINEIFKLVFKLDFLIDLDEFAKKLVSKDENDMFNNTDSGTRQKEFTSDATSKTEQYYYFQS